MKSNRLISSLLAGLVLIGATEFTLCSQTTNSLSQKIPERPGPGAMGGQGMFLAGLGPVGNVFTEAQRASFRQGMEAQREKMRDTEVKLRNARTKLLEAGLDGTFDEASVRQQALLVATLEAELSVIRAKALSQLQPPLSPEQIGKIKNGAAAPMRNGERFQPPGERQHHLTSTNRDENGLPPKQ